MIKTLHHGLLNLIYPHLLKHIIKKVLKENKEELKILERDTKKLEPTIKKKFPRMTYDQALKILEKKCKMKVEWGKDLRTIEEDKLSKLYDTPIMITHYPKKVKAFYMKEDPKNSKVVHGVDFIAPEGYGEIIGGSERIHDYNTLVDRIKEHDLPVENYDWYLDLRRYGSVPHSGFGLGVERTVAWICGTEHIRETSPYPRMINRDNP